MITATWRMMSGTIHTQRDLARKYLLFLPVLRYHKVTASLCEARIGLWWFWWVSRRKRLV